MLGKVGDAAVCQRKKGSKGAWKRERENRMGMIYREGRENERVNNKGPFN